MIDRITIKIVGINKHEYESGLISLMDEFTERPWLLRPQIWWDSSEGAFMVQIDRPEEDNDTDGQGTLDEVWDCILGIFNFEQRVEFFIESINRIKLHSF